MEHIKSEIVVYGNLTQVVFSVSLWSMEGLKTELVECSNLTQIVFLVFPFKVWSLLNLNF